MFFRGDDSEIFELAHRLTGDVWEEYRTRSG